MSFFKIVIGDLHLPLKTDGVTDSSTVAEKLEKMIVAHGPFLESCERIMGIYQVLK